MKNYRAIYTFLILSAALFFSEESYGQLIPVRCGTYTSVECRRPGESTELIAMDNDYITSYTITGISSSYYTVTVTPLNGGGGGGDDDMLVRAMSQADPVETTVPVEGPYSRVRFYWLSSAAGESAVIRAYMGSSEPVCNSGPNVFTVNINSSCGDAGCTIPVPDDAVTVTSDGLELLLPDDAVYDNTLYNENGCVYVEEIPASSINHSISQFQSLALTPPIEEDKYAPGIYYIKRTYYDPSEDKTKTCWLMVTVDPDAPDPDPDPTLEAQSEAQIPPLFGFIIGVPTDPLCGGGTVTLSVLRKYDRYTWFGPSLNTGTDTYEVTVSATTTITLKLADYNCSGISEYTHQATIYVDTPVTPSVSINAPKSGICAGDAETVRLTASSNVNDATYTWDDGLHVGSFIDVSPVTTTTYKVDLTMSDACVTSNTDTEFFTITVDPSPDVSFAGDDIEQCNTSSFTMGANIPDIGNGSWSGPSGIIITDVTNENTTVTGVVAGTSATLSWTITNGSCSDQIDDVILTNDLQPASNAGVDDETCSGQTTYTISGSTSGNGTIVWTSSSGGTFVDNNVDNPVYNINETDISNNTVTLTKTVSTALGICDDAVDAMELSVIPAPLAGADIEQCNTSSFTMAANNPTNVTGTWGYESGFSAIVIANLNSATTTVSGLTAGNSTTLRWTFSSESCSDETDYVVITNDLQPTSDAGLDDETCFDQSTYTISGSTSTNGTILWTSSSAGTFVSAIVDNPVYTIHADDVTAGTVTLTKTVSTALGICADAVDAMVLTVSEPTTPSPEADNIKETSFDVVWPPIEGVNSYEVSIKNKDADDAVSFSEIINSTSYSFSGLTGNHEYEVKVTAKDGDCGDSEPVTITVITIPPVVAFASIYINPLGGGTFDISWNLTSDLHEPRITHSEVEVQGDEDPIIHTIDFPGTTDQITGLDIGKEYTVYIRQANITGPSENSQPYYINLGRHLNSIETKLFDEDGNTVSHSKEYFDLAGKPLQSQTQNFTETKVIASIPIYDQYHRLVGNTLPAPIGLEGIGYRAGILRNEDNEAYDYEDLIALNPVGTQPNTIGSYYSDANTLEPKTPTTLYPYSSSDYYKDGTGEVKSAIGAGDIFRAEDGHIAYSGTMPVWSALDDYVSLRQLILPGTNDMDMTNNAIQNIGIDVNGIMSTSIADKNGNTIISGLQADEEADNPLVITHNSNGLNTGGLIYIYVQEGHEALSWSGTGTFDVYDLLTDTEVGIEYTVAAPPTLPAGFYKITTSPNDLSVTYQHAIDHVSYNFYDNAGRLVASVAPEGLKQILTTGLDIYDEDNIKDLPFTTWYEYNHQGWLLAMEEPDAGRTEYVYRKDGSIRFSQNQEQRENGIGIHQEYSYTNYDDLGRPVESGEYVRYDDNLFPIAFKSAEMTSALGDTELSYLPDGDDSEPKYLAESKHWVKTYYDRSTANFDDETNLLSTYPEDYAQDFIMGAVSWTENENIKTWYSYDEMGRVTWMAQKPQQAGFPLSFVVEYSYDFLGNVTQVGFKSFNDGVLADEFYHYYLYDADKRLEYTYSSVNDIELVDLPTDSEAQLQAKYEYYLHGPLKRIELGGNMQGVDFTYNIHGWLEKINDPGVNTDQAGFDDDAFSMVLSYYESSMPDLFLSANVTNPSLQHNLPWQQPSATPQLASLFLQFSPSINSNVFGEDQIKSKDFSEFSIHRSEYKKLLKQYGSNFSSTITENSNQ